MDRVVTFARWQLNSTCITSMSGWSLCSELWTTVIAFAPHRPIFLSLFYPQEVRHERRSGGRGIIDFQRCRR